MTSMSEQAWEEQDECLKSSRGGHSLHIIDNQGRAVCGQTPKSTIRSDPSVFRGWGVEWCRECLRIRYGGASTKQGNEEGVVVSASKPKASLSVYHSRECYTYPEETREASPREVEELLECSACRMTPREGVPE